MRIAHVGNLGCFSANGVHQAIARIAHMSLDDGDEVVVWHFTRKVRDVDERVEDGIPIVDLPVRATPRFGSHLQWPTRTTRDYLRTAARGNVDVVHLHSVFQPDHTWTSRLGVPFVLTPHGGYHPRVLRGSRRRRKTIWMRFQDARLLRSAAAVQVLSERERAQVRQISPAARLLVLPIPVPNGGSDTGALQLERPVNAPIVFMGRLDVDSKGLDLLLEAWKNNSPHHAGRNLILAGPGTEDTMNALQRQVSSLGLTKSVEMVGPVFGAAKNDLLNRAAWFVHASRREGLPISMLEAAQHGVPLIATVDTNLADRIMELSCGVTCETDVASLTAALNEALATPELERRSLARRSLGLAPEFSTVNLRSAYRSMYEGVL